MEFRYIIPKHIKGFVEDIPEAKLQEVMTFMFELAISHGLVDNPLFPLGGSTDIALLNDVLTRIVEEDRQNTTSILEAIGSLSSKIDGLNIDAAPRVLSADVPPVTKLPPIIYMREEDEPTEEVVDEFTFETEGYVETSPVDRETEIEEQFLEDMLK